MKPEEFLTLHADCLKAFEVYHKEASKMWYMLGRSQAGKPTLEERSSIQNQRLRENDAFARYSDLRARLFEAARLGYTDSESRA